MPPTSKRALLLVIDGLGVGEMPDRPEEDAGSNTLRHVHEEGGGLDIPYLSSLGLTRVAGIDEGHHPNSGGGAAGKGALRYVGADSYLGHQELMGSDVRIPPKFLAEFRTEIIEALTQHGYAITALEYLGSPLIVDGTVLVADNIETQPGVNVNVTASLDEVSFEELTRIGEIVRAASPVARVIVVGGRGFDIAEIKRFITKRGPDHVGVDTPGLGVYDEHYMVRHLGIEVDIARQLPTAVHGAGYEVVLLGKAADVVVCEGAQRENIIPTDEVLRAAESHWNEMSAGLLVVNVQESDLAGHEQDPKRFAHIIHQVEEAMPRLLGTLKEDDLFVLSADHGNDPSIGHGQHTREYAPIVVAGPSVEAISFKTRQSLADVAATLTEFFGVNAPETGVSFAKEILSCS